MVVKTGKRLASAFPEADVRIPLSGPFSLACNLVGFDRLLCDLLDDPASVEEALFFLAQGQIAFCKEVIAHGLDIAFFESGATPPLISPEMFAEIELPALKVIINETSALVGRPVPCIIGGNTEPILNSILGMVQSRVAAEKKKTWPFPADKKKAFPFSLIGGNKPCLCSVLPLLSTRNRGLLSRNVRLTTFLPRTDRRWP